MYSLKKTTQPNFHFFIPMYHRTFNKKSGRWSFVPYKVEKIYPYINRMINLMRNGLLIVRVSTSDPSRIRSKETIFCYCSFASTTNSKISLKNRFLPHGKPDESTSGDRNWWLVTITIYNHWYGQIWKKIRMYNIS